MPNRAMDTSSSSVRDTRRERGSGGDRRTTDGRADGTSEHGARLVSGRLTAVIGSFALVLAGCGAGAGQESAGSASPSAAPEPTVAVAGDTAEVVPPALAPGHLPPELERIEDGATRLFRIAPEGDWSVVAGEVESVERAWREWTGTPGYQDVPMELRDAVALRVRELSEEAAARQEPPILRAANNLQMAVFDLYEFYHLSLPPDLGRLEVAERNLLLDTASGDLLAARETQAGIGPLWRRVRSSIVQMEGGDLAAELDAVLARQRQAAEDGDVGKLEATADAALDLIDRMEGLAS